MRMTRAEAIAVINASDPTGETDATYRDAHLTDDEVIEEAEAIEARRSTTDGATPDPGEGE